jgi:hypothetical protein
MILMYQPKTAFNILFSLKRNALVKYDVAILAPGLRVYILTRLP